jgi:hypothetical protein
MELKDPWYYPRAVLAKQYVDLLVNGVMDRMTIFAPRRMGKTLFLLLDFTPAAEKLRYKVVYISLWSEIDKPHETILLTLQEAHDNIKKKRRGRELLNSTIKKIKFDGLFGMGAEVELAGDPQKAKSNDLFEIDNLLSKIAKLSKGRFILILDEIQHLTTSKQFDPLSYALRTSIDKLRGQINVVFTGSSRSGMRDMFGDNRAPFYHFSDQVPFPNLDREFIKHVCTTFEKIAHRKISDAQLWRLFVKLGYNPSHLSNIVKSMVLDPNLSMKAAYDQTLAFIAIDHGYEAKWKQLKPLDREVYQAIVKSRPLYSKKSLENFSKAVNKSITAPYVQRSVQRLIKLQLISPEQHGSYLNEAPGFAEWLENR